MCCRFELLGTLILLIQAFHDRRAQKRAAARPTKRRTRPNADHLHYQYTTTPI
jgi:hypothetical protein